MTYRGVPRSGVLAGRLLGHRKWGLKDGVYETPGNCVVVGILCEARRRYKKARQMAT